MNKANGLSHETLRLLLQHPNECADMAMRGFYVPDRLDVEAVLRQAYGYTSDELAKLRLRGIK